MEIGKQLILSFLEKVFDEPRKKNENLTEYEFNCLSEKCSRDHNKFNLFKQKNSILNIFINIHTYTHDQISYTVVTILY